MCLYLLRVLTVWGFFDTLRGRMPFLACLYDLFF